MGRRGRRAFHRHWRNAAFSLIEVVIALGLIVFVLIPLMALLPMGARSNQVSTEETRAANILTSLEMDLRNTRRASGIAGDALVSHVFGLKGPYASTATGATVVDPNLIEDRLYSRGLLEDETPVAPSRDARYQISVIYKDVPQLSDPSDFRPVIARIIVNWPCLDATADENDLTNPTKVTGYLDSMVSFPVP